MAQISNRIAHKVQEQFAGLIDAAAMKHLNIETETGWSIIELTYVTSRIDLEPLTAEQRQFITGYSEGFLDAVTALRKGVK